MQEIHLIFVENGSSEVKWMFCLAGRRIVIRYKKPSISVAYMGKRSEKKQQVSSRQ